MGDGKRAERERAVRRAVGGMVRKQDVVPTMIEKIKALFDADDRGGDAGRP